MWRSPRWCRGTTCSRTCTTQRSASARAAAAACASSRAASYWCPTSPRSLAKRPRRCRCCPHSTATPTSRGSYCRSGGPWPRYTATCSSRPQSHGRCITIRWRQQGCPAGRRCCSGRSRTIRGNPCYSSRTRAPPLASRRRTGPCPSSAASRSARIRCDSSSRHVSLIALPAPPRDCPHGCCPCVPSLPRSSLIPSPPRLSACSASSSTAASTHRYCCRCGTSRCTRRPIASASWCTRNPSR